MCFLKSIKGSFLEIGCCWLAAVIWVERLYQHGSTQHEISLYTFILLSHLHFWNKWDCISNRPFLSSCWGKWADWKSNDSLKLRFFAVCRRGSFLLPWKKSSRGIWKTRWAEIKITDSCTCSSCRSAQLDPPSSQWWKKRGTFFVISRPSKPTASYF